MASYTYPPAAPSLSGDVLTINRFLQNPTLVSRRLRTLLEQRFISDAILTGRFPVEGGAVLYETGETIYATDAPEAVAPGSEYPLTTAGTGPASVARTVKWGEDAEVTDESIKRTRMQPVNRALIKLANQTVKHVDSISLSAVATAVTATAAAAATWVSATGVQILRDALLAKQNIIALNQGYMPDTVVIDDINWAYALSTFVSAGFVPREANNNPALTGDFPVVAGMRWLATPNLPVAGQALVLDRDQLGGMADEDLGGPGYVRGGGVGVETKSIRDDLKDQYRLRCRRVTVPVVVEPAAARKITGL